jgi:hypothetical protein
MVLKWQGVFSPEPVMPPAPQSIPDDWRLWPSDVLERRDWFRQAPEELMLIDALRHQGKYRELLDRNAWFLMMLPLLTRVRVESLVAANFEYEPRPYPDAWQAHDDYVISVSDSVGGTHRSVTWEHPAPCPRRLWIDGREIVPESGLPFELVSPGVWASDEVFVADVPAPDDHPAQDFGLGGHPVILGLLVVDAGRARTHVVQPAASERWTAPRLHVRDGRWHVYASDSATEPARVIDPAA